MRPRFNRIWRKKKLVNLPLQMTVVLYSSGLFLLGSFSSDLQTRFEPKGHVELYGMGPVPVEVLFLIPLALLVCAVLIGFALTNRIAGPIFSLHQHMKGVLSGQSKSPMSVRRKDYFQEVIETYNALLAKYVPSDPKDSPPGGSGGPNGNSSSGSLDKSKRRSNQSGFNLIELMVALGISATLMLVAMPKYQRFIEKVRLAQAKIALSNLYVAEKAFSAEWDTFSGRLDAIGFDIDGSSYFDIGFDADFASPLAPQGNPACHTLCTVSCPLYNAFKCRPEARHALDGNHASFAAIDRFRAVAHSHFGDEANGEAADPKSLSIDETRTLLEIFPAF